MKPHSLRNIINAHARKPADLDTLARRFKYQLLLLQSLKPQDWQDELGAQLAVLVDMIVEYETFLKKIEKKVTMPTIELQNELERLIEEMKD